MPLHIKSIETAAHDTIRDYPGGAWAITDADPALLKAPHSLLNEVNPKCARHKLGLIDSALIQKITQDYSILLAYAGYLDHTVIPLTDEFNLVSDVELLNTFTQWVAQNGDVARAVNHALEDQKVTAEEYQLVRNKYLLAIQAGHTFLDRMKSLIDE